MAPSQHLRSTLGRTRASGLAFATALVIGATLVLSGCGAQEAGAAAIVNGTVISEQDVQSVPEQLNKLAQGGQQLRTSDALLSLILAPYVLAEAKRAGKTVSASQARLVIAKVSDPSPSTIEFVQMQLAVRQLDQASKTSIVNELGKAKITINPRYGSFDAKKVAIAPISPNWFVKTDAVPPAK
ncbi:MAG: SurA N-terminal domain-containing protein [Dermatophilaceae bacterium]